MTTENGSLIYITPEGYVVDTAYRRVNGTDLGNVAQDAMWRRTCVSTTGKYT